LTINAQRPQAESVQHPFLPKVCWRKISTSRQAHGKPKKAGLTHVAESEAWQSIFLETDKGWK
jgi:hypothetical protein